MRRSRARPSRVVASLLVELMAWCASARRPLPIQRNSSGRIGSVVELNPPLPNAGMRVMARARARSAEHSRPNLIMGRRSR
eukprot:scaffold132647_cov39-Phaeocystis_antarctica.AAC.1